MQQYLALSNNIVVCLRLASTCVNYVDQINVTVTYDEDGSYYIEFYVVSSQNVPPTSHGIADCCSVSSHRPTHT